MWFAPFASKITLDAGVGMFAEIVAGCDDGITIPIFHLVAKGLFQQIVFIEGHGNALVLHGGLRKEKGERMAGTIPPPT